MKIRHFEFWPILVPDFRLLNVSGLHGPFTPRIVIRCTLDNDFAGWSEIPCNSGILKVLQELTPELKDTPADMSSVERMLLDAVTASQKIVRGAGFADQRGTASFDRGITNHVRAGLQMAAHAAIAEATGIPLCDLIAKNGRLRDFVRFNLYLFFLADPAGSILDYSFSSPRHFSNRFEQLRETAVLDARTACELVTAGIADLMPGVQLVKWKLGVLDPDAELEVMLAVAQAIGPDVKLVPDPNAAWTTDVAVGFIRKLKEALGEQLPYFEDPVPGHAAMAEVHRQTGVPLATNMCAATFEEHEAAVSSQAIQITLGGDPHYIGGSDMAVALSHWAEKRGIGFGQHSNTHLGISNAHTLHMGCAAAIHELPFDTHYFPWQRTGDLLVPDPMPIENGGICRVPDRPGLGVDVSEDGLRELHALFLEKWSQNPAWENRDDGWPAAEVYNGWVRPGDRPQKWFFAGVSQ